jgi:hypothetical protein
MLATLLFPPPASAGMPEVTLADIQRVLVPTELTEGRFQALSFFAVGLFVCAAIIRWIWNGLRKDFPIVPRLSYPRALGLVFLWGLIFVLILTMISGARELLTPGAWEKVPGGVTYRLAQPTEPTAVERQITERCEAIGRLGRALSTFQGHYPKTAQETGLPDEYWLVPGTKGERYVYVGEPRVKGGIVACEPESLGSDRLTVTERDGPVWSSSFAIEQELVDGRSPWQTEP